MNKSTGRKARPKRSKLFVDRALQGALLGRVVSYWCACLLFMTLPMAIALAVSNEKMTVIEIASEIWRINYPMLIAVFLLLPIAIYDVLKLSNKFVGPLCRHRRMLARLANGEKPEKIKIRDGDFWQDLSESSNMLIERLERTIDQ